MNKWFESKNIANYAKTALLQAQKRIDQVLDIKEEDIINDSARIEDQILGTASSISTSSKNESSSKLPSVSSSNQIKDLETDSFFSDFLNQSSSNQKTKNDTKQTETKTPVTFSLEPKAAKTSDSKTPERVPSPALSHTETSDKKLAKKLSSKSSKQQPSQHELDKIEKQNWVQSYVDSNGNSTTNLNVTNTSALTTSTSSSTSSSSSTLLINNKPQQSSESTQDDSNKDDTNTLNTDSDSTHVVNKTDDTLVNSGLEMLNSQNEKIEDITETNENLIEVEEISKEDDQKTEPIIEDTNTDISNTNNEAVTSGNAKNSVSLVDIDFVKIDAGGSSLSGNASSTEEGLETCASSDIEVLSLPSNSGDQLLALHNANRSTQVPSLASMAAFISNQNNSNNLSNKDANINKNNTILGGEQNKSSANKMQSQVIGNSNVMFVKSPPPSLNTLPKTPSSFEKPSPSTTNTPEDTSNQEKSSQVLLDAREAQILKLNKQNVKLQEDNDNLINELEKYKYETSEKFAKVQQAYADLNNKCEQTSTERDQLKKILNDLQRELVDSKNVLKEKDSQVEQLTQEGLKLSKQELNQSNIIKKLRNKEKENEETLNILKNEYQKSQKELEELKKILDAKEEMETKNMDAFKKLEKVALTLEKELANTKNQLEDSDEKVKSLENNLQNAYKELAELHKANASKESKINEAATNIENQLKEEIQLAVEKERIIANKKQESLKWELQSVRADITRVEQQHALREDMLRKEIADLQQQLRDSEMRNNELSQNISNATRPLLRQIENLQTSHGTQIELLENSERNLIERLKESQANLCEMTEKNRQNQDAIIDLTQQVKTFEAQLQTLKLEKSKLNAEYQLIKSNQETYENEKFEKEAQQRVLVNSLNQQIENLTREKKYLESQYEIEKVKTENELKKFQDLINEYNKEREIQQQLKQQQSQVASLNDSVSSTSSSNAPSLQSPSLYSKLSSSVLDSSKNDYKMSEYSYNTNSGSGIFNILETLQSKLKLKEGEVIQLQKEIQNLERIRESMAKEMVNLSNKLDQVQEQVKEYPLLQDKFNKLNIEYNALLTMYGEKSEEVEELRMDLHDVKEMYKLQIEDLIKRSNI